MADPTGPLPPPDPERPSDTAPTLEPFRQALGADPLRLDLATLTLAAHCAPHDVDVDAALQLLDELAAALPEPTLDGVVRLLFRDKGYRGDRDQYYDPANSYLDQVLERRIGIPISLSVLLIEVGRRAGVPLFGVGMPGHFLVGDRVAGDVYVDAFRGTVIDSAAARGIFEAMQPGVGFHPSFLDETPPSVIVMRMLNNLRMIHQQANDHRALVPVLESLTCFPDCPLDEYRQLAFALEQRGRVDLAARRLEEAAERYGGTDGQQLRAQATRMWARLN